MFYHLCSAMRSGLESYISVPGTAVQAHCCDQGFNHQRALLSQYLPLLEAILATNDVPSSSAIIKIILWVLDLDLGPCHFIHSLIFLDKQHMCNGPRTHKTPLYISDEIVLGVGTINVW